MNILITGGAGFIGTHLARRLLKAQQNVTILDNFSPQVHGVQGKLAADIAGRVTLISGDVRDRNVVAAALLGQETVVHLAAETGTGQSMYEIERYEDVNIKGTALLLDLLVNGETTVTKVVMASSRAIYGEGAYRCEVHGLVYPGKRKLADLQQGRYEPVCPRCGAPCVMLPTDEDAQLHPTSFYGITKQVQEQMTLMLAESLGISAFALRYQNVYGPGQSLANPYTGILAIFSNQARVGAPIYIFEDGRESRDFVFVDDVVEATWRCIRPEAAGIAALNIGSGELVTVHDVAREIVAYFGGKSAISVTGAFRDGDIRHNLADLTRVRQMIGYEPRDSFPDGVKKFLAWAEAQQEVTGGYENSLGEMTAKGLMHGRKV